MLRRRFAIVLVTLTLSPGVAGCGEAREKEAPGDLPGEEERQRQQIQQQQPPEVTHWKPPDRTIGERIQG
jgi:hypothetical protein